MKTYSELLGELAVAVHRVNSETKFAAFMDIAGHVGCVGIRVAESRELYRNILARTTLYYPSVPENQPMVASVKWFEDTIAQLNRIAETGHVHRPDLRSEFVPWWSKSKTLQPAVHE